MGTDRSEQKFINGYGYTFNDEMRKKLAEAIQEYLEDSTRRVKLNQIIMDIEQPYIDRLNKVAAALK